MAAPAFLRRAFERNGNREDLEVDGKGTVFGWLVRGEDQAAP